MEVMTADQAVRARCFTKLRDAEHEGAIPLDLLPNVGALLRFECETQQPSTPLRGMRMVDRFTFGEKAVADDFRLSAEQIEALREWRDSYDPDEFQVRSRTVLDLHPDLRSLTGGELRGRLQEIGENLSADQVLEFYEAVRPSGFPAVDRIDENWAVYRFVQVQLLAALDFVERHGPSAAQINIDKLENSLHDYEYATVASLAGGLASRDRPLVDLFRRARPDGIVVESARRD